ncbi:MAG: glycyl-radical enzyme activating protein [Deltaproteobacteria bacterium]|jgi:pyruvate formate lyase activating enzyme|nr:glycyl-radical enzyme activating protein [Deltaproteobacteria bacterium]
MNSGLIFDTKRYAINDGPGIRMTIFMKGCPLKCVWCHNPESISPKQQKLYTDSKCIACGECVKACPNQACELTPKGIITDSELCRLCGKCAEICPSEATQISGKYETLETILTKIEQEIIFFDQSGGGITVSGGEPLYQSDFLLELLDACQKRDIHCAVDTSGFAKKTVLLEVARKTDLFLYDLKMMDDKKHKKYTGISNQKILSNLVELAKTGADINIRIPLIKGVNDDEENIVQSAKFIAALAGDKKTVNILPFHNIAIPKYLKLGQDFDLDGMAEPTESEQQQMINKFAEYGLEAKIGG